MDFRFSSFCYTVETCNIWLFLQMESALCTPTWLYWEEPGFLVLIMCLKTVCETSVIKFLIVLNFVKMNKQITFPAQFHAPQFLDNNFLAWSHQSLYWTLSEGCGLLFYLCLHFFWKNLVLPLQWWVETHSWHSRNNTINWR